MTSSSPEPLIVVDAELVKGIDTEFFTNDTMFREDKDGLPEPHFTVKEVAKVFFGHGPDWLRWRIREGFFVLDGEEVGVKRSKAGFRIYTLADIERMAHALAQRGGIDGAQLSNVIVLVKTIARVYGYL